MTIVRLRSFVRRGGRGTKSQARAQDIFGPDVCLQVSAGWLVPVRDFGRIAPLVLEIGFGSGNSLLSLAKAHPEINFIGIETYKPGIGALLLAMKEQEVTNIRLYDADAVDVLEKCIRCDSLQAAQLFFPDPWQKRRHNGRRLIQPEFLKLLNSRLQVGGQLHLATDWADYAEQMMQVLSASTELRNTAGVGEFSERSAHRPVITKFERRALREGRLIRDLRFEKV